MSEFTKKNERKVIRLLISPFPLKYLENKLVFLLLLMFVHLASSFAQDIIINEVMTKNVNFLFDENLDTPDWLEIYNKSSSDINLKNHFLSDDPGNPAKWNLPDKILPSNEFLLLFASGKDRRDGVKQWETIIDRGDEWKYKPGTSEPSRNWNSLEYNDNDWISGSSGFGYGDADDNTVIPDVNSIYIRKEFSLSEILHILYVILHVDYDDGFAAYINGVEVARANLGEPGSAISYNQRADAAREALIYAGGKPEKFVVANTGTLLKEGRNVIAIQVHNYGTTSSDLTLIPFLTLGYDYNPIGAGPVNPLLDLFEGNLHTNFNISSSGETVYLFNSSNYFIDSVKFENAPNNISFGRKPDGSENWFYFDNPTPGSPNLFNGIPGRTLEPEFILPSGFYDNPLILAFSNTQGKKIYYTLDGSEPGVQSDVYTNPFTIFSTTTVKARAFGINSLPSGIVTKTYFINSNHTLPVISVSTSPENFWDPDSGIYVMGDGANPEFPHFGANFWKDWEKPAFVEYFDENGNKGFEQSCGIKIFGVYSRGYPQKSLSVFFKAKYGDSKLRYNLFPDFKINEFSSFLLRNSGNDFISTMLRDGFMQTLVEDLDIDKQKYRPAVVYLNGEYWGIHNIREKINKEYIASHHELDPQAIDLLEFKNEVIEGSNEDYLAMLNYLETHDLSDKINYLYVISQIDKTSYIDYNLSQIYFDNRDWPGNNIKYWKSQGLFGKWRWIMHDTDFGFGIMGKGCI